MSVFDSMAALFSSCRDGIVEDFLFRILIVLQNCLVSELTLSLSKKCCLLSRNSETTLLRIAVYRVQSMAELALLRFRH